jgi:hypothetical protein
MHKPDGLLVLGFIQARDRFYWPRAPDHRLISKTDVSKRQYILCSISHVHPYIQYVFFLLSSITKTNIYLGMASLENSRPTLNTHSVNK